MAAVLAFLKAIPALLRSIPSLVQLALVIIDGVKAVRDWMRRRRQDEVIEDAKTSVDHTTATGDQRSEESAITGAEGGAPAQDRRGVRVRPIQEDEK